jgi:DNA-binding NtrC family response regulator
MAGEAVAERKLVPDFHTALSVLEIAVPPLRDRFADLPRLAAHFLPTTAVESAVFDVLRAQPWPGNLREFADTLTEAATLTTDGPLKVEHLPRELRVRAGLAASVPQKPLALDTLLKTIEAKLIRLALERAGGNATVAAERLDIGRIRVVRQVKTKVIRKPEDKS